MRQWITGGVLIVALSGLIGCHSSPKGTEEQLRPMAQHYRGKLPCGACGDIDAALFLDADGSFVMQESYRDRTGGQVMAEESGRWRRTAEQLILTDDHGDKHYFRARDAYLEALGQDKNPLSDNRYRLFVVDFMTTPVSWHGVEIGCDSRIMKTFALNVRRDVGLESAARRV
ncbi:copper resistance protein NlpE N-terminal domain-containing protein [Musicola keenii]|uniref:copper resistance protein NlpE N-terminal domain-containing protein n=1 Tax=Musicola keenii TaxID=2884250 RepID=UPI00177AA736|nr:copper resistance protein NlpE N-terminal domain-containing protein [Musicola keenii]